MTDAPNAYKMMQAMSALQSARMRIAQDEDLLDDATGEILDLAKIEDNAGAMLHATLRAAVAAEAMAYMVGNMIIQLKGRQARFERRADTLRAAALSAMDAMELRKVELPDMTVTLAVGAPGVVITDEAALPNQVWRTTRSVDKSALSKLLKAGETIPGAELANAAPSLRIKRT